MGSARVRSSLGGGGIERLQVARPMASAAGCQERSVELFLFHPCHPRNPRFIFILSFCQDLRGMRRDGAKNVTQPKRHQELTFRVPGLLPISWLLPLLLLIATKGPHWDITATH